MDNAAMGDVAIQVKANREEIDKDLDHRNMLRR